MGGDLGLAQGGADDRLLLGRSDQPGAAPARQGSQACQPVAPVAPSPDAAVLGETLNRRANGRTPSPRALARITRARNATPCVVFGARNHDSSIASSASATLNPAAMRPAYRIPFVTPTSETLH
jgi:hypothetical protein